jgi:hypothetical protein
MMPKAYTSAALLMRPRRSSSGAMWDTVPSVRVLRCVWPTCTWQRAAQQG